MEKYDVRFWLVAAVVLVLDRISKFLVVAYVPLGQQGFITHILNTGTAFGLFKSAHYIIIAISVLVIIFLALKHSDYSTPLLLGLVMGGAAGNLVDRLWYGAVIDFIDVGFWPVVNIADSAITCAVVGLIVNDLLSKRRKI